MKTPSLLFAFVFVAVSVPDLPAQSTESTPPRSTKDRIREEYAYESPPLASVAETAPSIPATDLYSYSAEKTLARRLAVKRRFTHDPFENVRFFGVVRDDSFLSAMADRITAFEDDYRKIRGGLEYTVLGQPVTLYVHSRLVVPTGKYESLVLTWSGKVTLAKEWKF